MNKAKLYLIPFLFLLTIVSCGENNKGIGDKSKPNILLISIDSLRRDHLSCYAYIRETSPNIDKLAAKGTIFENAVSTTCWTLPSHMSMFTGLYILQHGVHTDKITLNPSIKTVTQYLKEDGYQTHGIFSGPYLHSAYGFSRGFDEYNDCSNSKKLAKNDVDLTLFESKLGLMHQTSHMDITSYRIVETFSEWFENKKNNKPFFSFIHMWDVHFDYIPPHPYDKLFDPDYKGTITSENFDDNQRINPEMCTRDLEHIIALYDGEIKWTDYNIGKIIDILANAGELKNTVVIITADHGDEFFEHGNKGHAGSLYDELVRVPLIIYNPSLFPHQRNDSHVSLIDILPTILDARGLEVPEYVQGQSLIKVAKETRKENRKHLLENRCGLKSVRTRNWKFIYDVPKKIPYYFDLYNDPKEIYSLIPLKEPIIISDQVKEDVKKSLTFFDSIQETVPSFGSKEIKKPELDNSTIEHLKSLGYID